MTSATLRANALRFFFLLGLQFILKGVDYANIDLYIYPLFVLLLPVELLPAAAIGLAFVYGWLVDAFYNTSGLFASAAVLVAGARPLALALLTPRGGYELGKPPTKHHLGINWFLRYSGILMLLHTLWVVTLEQLQIFSLLWLLSVVLVFLLSMVVVILYQFLFNPKE